MLTDKELISCEDTEDESEEKVKLKWQRIVTLTYFSVFPYSYCLTFRTRLLQQLYLLHEIITWNSSHFLSEPFKKVSSQISYLLKKRSAVLY